MFKIMTDGLVLSRHETYHEALAAMATAKREALEEKERLVDEVAAMQAFADSFSIARDIADGGIHRIT